MISSWDLITSRTSVLTTIILDIHYHSPTVTSSQILSILRSNPSLREITLRGGAVHCDGGDKSSRVALAHLKILALSGVLEDGFPLLHHLDYPVKMDNLTLNVTDATINDISEKIGPYLRDHLRRRGRSRNGLGLYFSSKDTIEFHVEDVGETDLSAPGTAWLARLVTTSIQLGQVPPKDLLEETLLNLVAHIPQEEIVYFKARGGPISTEAISTQFPYLRAMHFVETPLDVAFPKSVLDRNRIFPCLQHLTLSVGHNDNWKPLITFLDHLASSGNKLYTLEIGGCNEMKPKVEEGVRRAVRELRVQPGFLCLDC